jgi:hypothetical protein
MGDLYKLKEVEDAISLGVGAVYCVNNCVVCWVEAYRDGENRYILLCSDVSPG